MYSLVLMTAMTTAPDGAEFNGLFSNLFSGGNSCSGSSCNGNCYGNYAPRYSCYGGGCSSSSAASNCNGCTGSSSASNGCNGCNGSSSSFGSRIRKWFAPAGSNGSCNGCNGSGGSGYGCSGSGSGYGCCGSSVGYSCFGASSYSCFGGPAVAYTPIINGGLSCQGGMAWPAPAPVFESGPGMPGMPGMIPPPMIPPATIPYAPTEPAPSPQNTGFRQAGTGTALVSNGGSARATVIVRLPVDARLFAESKALTLVGAERKFVSPELPMGQEFTYHFRVEYERDGELLSVTKKVAVRAGASLSIEFTDLTAKASAPEKISPEKTTGGGGTAVVATPTSNPSNGNATQPTPTPTPALPSIVPTPTEPTGVPDRATITVKLPAGATLFVDDRKSPSNDPVRRFSTPPLPAGRDFAYLMRAEIVRNGQTETFTQKVPFRAGERVDVDFTGVGR